MADNPGAGGGAKAAQVGRRVALGDLTNVVAGGGRLGGPDAGLTEKEVDEAGKLKSCSTNVELLKEKLVEKQGHRERVEMELPKLKKIEAKGDMLEPEFGSCKVLGSDKPDVSPYGDVTQKQVLTNLNEVGKATLAEDSTESATGEISWLEHPFVAISEERDTMKDQSMLTKQETINVHDTSLKDMLSGLHGMDKIFISLDRTMDKLIITHDFHSKQIIRKVQIRRIGANHSSPCLQRLSAKYISKPLLSCLHKGVGYAHFEVDGEDRGTITVKLNADGRASLTSGWENVVAAKGIKVGDICAFHFKIIDGVLKLSVYVFHPVHHVCVR